ncbi:hypothetical protein EET67_14395 [Pseudaminobacter arsenicus]|uniref:Fenitrothion hydrolase n=1 Tax=Borborobacter arsenicus TaxID=1851146 RepID=A0A432V4G8_9HYPH|nr:hypothetical protein [Pseudaminobacter arsenicus]RUM97056.1 hypothetical protein EET67_14395 [Pseudaminobacter arsenicus]
MSGRTEGGASSSRLPIAALPAALLCALWTGPAFAHASERGHVLLLPTDYYIAGGAIAVAASFLVLAILPPKLLERLAAQRLALFSISKDLRVLASLCAFALFATLVAAGLFGSRDPLSNPLPLTIWTLLWVGMTLVQGVFGNLWSWINPWYGPWRLLAALFPAIKHRTMPERPGYWPAVLLFLAFAWFELIDPAPDDPARLASAAGLYWLASFVLMIAFGYNDWSRRSEFLSVFFGMISRFAVTEAAAGNRRVRLSLCWPGARLWHAKPLPVSGIAFLLLVLSSVSFDGLSKTFFWLGLIGINPLEFPGRSAVMAVNTLGLMLTFAALSCAYLAAVRLGERLAASGNSLADVAGLMVWSIAPIALVYHFSHYLTALLVDGQYALVALSDPFSLGWNLLGTAHFHVEAGIVAGHDSAWALWNAQAVAIIAGHALAVLIAHALAFRLHEDARRATMSQFPLTVLMIFYTVFGLWLLSTPTAG